MTSAPDEAFSSAKRLRVGMNLLWLRPGEVGGTESYATRLISALLSCSEPPEIRSYCAGETAMAHPETVSATTVCLAPSGSTTPLRRVVTERRWLASEARDIDVLHHLGGTVPGRSDQPIVVTIHDLQPLDDPTNFSPLKRRWLGMAIPSAIKRANIVVTPSSWVGQTIVDRFGIDPDRVQTVSAFAHVPSGLGDASALVEGLLARGPVFFYPAMTMAHKNHEFLFDAFVRATQVRPEIQLVCVGAVGRHHQQVIRASAASPSIHVLGHVSISDLWTLMRRAEALVFPSRYEGFGLPVVEAQHLGVPVIASTAPALQEVTGGAAGHISPDDRDGWAEALSVPLESSRRLQLVADGHQNSARFTSDAMAVNQLRAYRAAIATT